MSLRFIEHALRALIGPGTLTLKWAAIRVMWHFSRMTPKGQAWTLNELEHQACRIALAQRMAARGGR